METAERKAKGASMTVRPSHSGGGKQIQVDQLLGHTDPVESLGAIDIVRIGNSNVGHGGGDVVVGRYQLPIRICQVSGHFNAIRGIALRIEVEREDLL